MKIGGAIDAVITAVCIRDNFHITYEVVSWNGNDRRCEWLESFEVNPPLCNGDGIKRATVGFVNS